MTITAPGETRLGPFSGPGATETPWENTIDALRRIQKYLVSTVREDGRPHVTPLLATVAMDGLCFCTGADEQKSKNLERNPNCILIAATTSLVDFDYVIEGTAAAVTDGDDLERAATTFEANFGWHVTAPEGTWHGMTDSIRDRSVLLYEVKPTKAFAYGNGLHFSETRYRWPERLG